jgi:hypothetical protein
VGGRDQHDQAVVRLWIEHAHQSLAGARGPDAKDVCGDVVRTFQNEERFSAILASGPQGGAGGKAKATWIADSAASMLEQGGSPDTVVESILDTLPRGEHAPFSILQVVGGCQAHLVECDAPPFFLTRRGRLVLLPVLEDVCLGHLVRHCQFLLQDGDHMAMVSEGYIHAKGWSRRWAWRDIAISTRRWTDTGCDAEQLLGALIRMYGRLAEGQSERDVTVMAMHVRPRRSATLWSGPPADRALDRMALEELMAEPGMRIICGDTTGQIAARLLGTKLEIEPRPPEGWGEVPPTARLEGVHLVTEGLVTLREARERLAAAEHARDLPRAQDGATRLAGALLDADVVHFIVGLAVNPQQAVDADGTIPLRRMAIEGVMRDLEAQGKVVSAKFF